MVKLHDSAGAHTVYRAGRLAEHLLALAIAERDTQATADEAARSYYHGTASHFVGPPTPQHSETWGRKTLFLSPDPVNASVFAIGARSKAEWDEPRLWQALVPEADIYRMPDEIQYGSPGLGESADAVDRLLSIEPALVETYGFVEPPDVGIDIDYEQILSISPEPKPHWVDIHTLDPTNPRALEDFIAWSNDELTAYEFSSIRAIRDLADQPGNEWLREMVDEIDAGLK